ncbi:MAG: hypothetical protein ACJAS1_001457 [Oleiphilaceae bacterium]|jgi:hypothetical protein
MKPIMVNKSIGEKCKAYYSRRSEALKKKEEALKQKEIVLDYFNNVARRMLGNDKFDIETHSEDAIDRLVDEKIKRDKSGEKLHWNRHIKVFVASELESIGYRLG